VFDDIEVITSLPPRRWPLHPTPYPFEWIDGYIRRLAEHYQISVKTFCRSGLGSNIDLNTFADAPSHSALMHLSAGTGIPISELRKMTRACSQRRLMIALRELCQNHPEEVQKWHSRFSEHILFMD